jgi:hypothetical protein
LSRYEPLRERALIVQGARIRRTGEGVSPDRRWLGLEEIAATGENVRIQTDWNGSSAAGAGCDFLISITGRSLDERFGAQVTLAYFFADDRRKGFARAFSLPR